MKKVRAMEQPNFKDYAIQGKTQREYFVIFDICKVYIYIERERG